jgi:enoyl-CoA hydratase/carnithine racemase
MTDEDELIVSRDGHVAVVEMHRPPHNFFDEISLRFLAESMTKLDEDIDVRAIVLAARGKSFSAGAVLGRPAPPGPKSRSELIYDEARKLFAIRTPIVAAIEGNAIGGGLGLATMADFRVASTRARFSANFTQLGFHPGFALSYVLPRLVGQQAAALLLLTSRRIDATQAHEIGLVDLLTDEGGAFKAAVELARQIAANAPLAVQATRETLREGLLGNVHTALDRELAEQVRLKETADFQEGVAAARERRKPEFKGR